MPPKPVSSISLCYWNANTLKAKKPAVRAFLESSNTDILLVGETRFRPGTIFSIPNYETYATCRSGRPDGGTAVFIKKTIPHCLLPTKLPAGSTIETTGVLVNITGQGPVEIHAIYYPPQKTGQPSFHPAELTAMLRNNTPKILMGDFNAKHSAWHSRVNNSRGVRLALYQELNQIAIVGPESPTRRDYSTRRADVLDITVLQNITLPLELTAREEPLLDSDHLPIFTTLGTGRTTELVTLRHVDWTRYQSLINSRVQPPSRLVTEAQLDQAADNLQNTIQQCLQEATITRHKPRNKLHLTQALKELLRDKSRAKKEYQDTLSPSAKTKLNRITNQVKSELAGMLEQRWSKWLEEIAEDDPPHTRLWKVTRQLKSKRRPMPPLQTSAGFAITDGQKAQALADSLEEQCTPNPLANWLLEIDHELSMAITAKAILETPSDEELTPPSCQEVSSIVTALNRKKAPGLDGISNTAIKNLPEVAISALTEVAAAAVRQAHFPACWKTAKTIGILKPRKQPSCPGSYRPISLLSGLGKVLEQIILGRLKDAVQEADALPPEQHGFRSNHSTLHQLARVVTLIVRGYNRGETTVAVFLDVEKAFDRIWHERLLVKLFKLKLPLPLIQLIGSYLESRTFQVQVNEELSRKTPLKAGVPQGSPLSPLLYALYTADIPTREHIDTAMYADDTLILSAAKNRTTAVNRLNSHLKTVSAWLQKNGIKINADKTVAVAFNRRGIRPKSLLSVDGIPIPWSASTRYLGVTLDEKLTFRPHTLEARNKGAAATKILFPVLNRRSSFPPELKIRLYKTIIRPAITYGCPIWHLADRKYIRHVEITQNKVLRMALGAPYYLANRIIAKDAEVEPLAEYLTTATKKFLESIPGHSNKTISDIQEMSRGPQRLRLHPLNPANLQTSQVIPPARPPPDPPPNPPYQDETQEAPDMRSYPPSTAPVDSSTGTRTEPMPYRPYSQ